MINYICLDPLTYKRSMYH